MVQAPVSPLDPHALLCERCGYSIAGLRREQACPECGQLAGLSWVENRPGSVYQIYRTLKGRWFWGNAEVLRSPRRLFRVVRIDPPSCSRLLYTNLMLTAALVTAGYISVAHEWLVASLLIWFFTFAGLLLLTYIETLGLRLFARAESRRWRITKDVAWTICDHASVGWVAGGVLMLVVFTVDPAGRLCASDWANDQARRLVGASFNDRFEFLRMLQMVLPLFAGMLTFETLVYLGVRQCRYANTPASAAQQGASGGPSGAAHTRGDDTATASA